MKRVLALCLVFLTTTLIGTIFGVRGLSDAIAQGCPAADSVLAGNLMWVRPCTGPYQLQADSKGCQDWAVRRLNIGNGANSYAKVKGLYAFCMQSRGYSVIAFHQVFRNCWNNGPLVPERSCCECPVCSKYTLSHDGRARVIETIPEIP